MSNPLDLTGPEFLTLYLGLLVLAARWPALGEWWRSFPGATA